MSKFKKATKFESKLRMAINGPSGSGKTFTSLTIASVLADYDGRIALVDTEHGSASKYASEFNFDVLELEPPFHPDRFIEAINDAQKEGYAVLVIDSLSHAWMGSGGLLEVVDQIGKKYKGNSYAAWGEGTPIQNRLIDTIIRCNMHLIVTMRSKEDYVLVERNGKQVPQKIGMSPVQRNDMSYEYDVVMDMDIDNTGIISKTRCSALTGKIFTKPGNEVATILSEWLKGEPIKTDGQVTEKRQLIVELGKQAYNGEWETKKPQLILYVSKKRTNNLDSLTLQELTEMENGIRAKIPQNEQPQESEKDEVAF